jgi:hypothetical protein
MAKPKNDAGAAAQAYYEKSPSSKVGEFAHANAQVADLNAKTSTESTRTGDPVPAR